MHGECTWGVLGRLWRRMNLVPWILGGGFRSICHILLPFLLLSLSLSLSSPPPVSPLPSASRTCPSSPPWVGVPAPGLRGSIAHADACRGRRSTGFSIPAPGGGGGVEEWCGYRLPILYIVNRTFSTWNLFGFILTFAPLLGVAFVPCFV